MKSTPSYIQRLAALKKSVNGLADQNFAAAKDGTHHKVFVSDEFVIRFRDDQQSSLINESRLLESLSHDLIPEIIWTGESAGFMAMVQKKLPGKALNKIWPGLTADIQEQTIEDLSEFIGQMRSIASEDSKFYSVKNGKSFNRYIDLLLANFERDKTIIRQNPQARNFLSDLLKVLEDSDLQNLFNIKNGQLVHGDLILHNLLSDGERLTGVLDWELAFYGDQDYDLARLRYYQECARAYPEGEKNCEPEFLKQFFATAIKNKLIADLDNFNQKYKYYRVLFIFRALKWAVQSKDPKNNIKELEDLYKKEASR